jgi:peroxiredoxin
VPAPDAVVHALDGSEVKLSSVLDGKRTLLVFYKGGWCPPCNFQLHQLAQQYAEISNRGLQLVALSVDQPTESAKTHTELELPFTVLSDQDLAAHQAYRVTEKVGGFTRAMLSMMGANLGERSGRDHHTVAVPALFLVDERGLLRWAHVDPDYEVRPTVAQILAVVDRELKTSR